MKYLMILILLIPIQVNADNWFASSGIAWHDQKTSGPEIQLDSWLFEAEIGHEWTLNDNVALQGYLRHTSGIKTQESGFGLNPVGLRIVAEW